MEMKLDPTAVDAAGLEAEASKKGGVLTLTVGNGGAQAARLLISILIAQLLGPAGRGAVALISVIDAMSTALFTAGLPIAAGFHAKLKLDSDSALINAAFRSGVLLLPLTVLVGAAIGVFALSALEPGARWLTVMLIAWTGVVNLPGMTAANILQAHRKLRKLAIYRVMFNLVTLMAVVVFAVTGELTVAWVAVAFAIARIATGLYGLVSTAWPSPGPSARLGPLFRYGLKAVPGSIGTLLNNRLDQLVIAPMVSLSDLGLYAVAAGTSFPPTALAMSMASGSFATVSHDGHLGREGSAATAIRHGLLVSAIAAAALALVAPLLVPFVYGSAFSGAVVPTVILLGGSVAWGGQLVASQCANALGYPSYASISEVAGLCVTVGGLALFVPEYGIVAAAIVSSAAYVTRLLVTLALLRRSGVSHFVPGPDDAVWLWRRGRRALTRRR